MAACKDLGTCSVTVDGRLATITITPPARLEGGTSDLHWDLGESSASCGAHRYYQADPRTLSRL
jgi:hypothetical protein